MPTPIKLTVILLAGLVAVPAYAYIDPNSGGLIFQILTPILALAAAAMAFAGRQINRAWVAFSRAAKSLLDRILRTLGFDFE
jgi:uncharacterized membrane protein